MKRSEVPEEIKIESNVVKGEDNGYRHFLLFSQCFLYTQREIVPFAKNEIVGLKCIQFKQG